MDGGGRGLIWGEGRFGVVQVEQFVCERGGGGCPQGRVLVNHRLPLPPLALALTIPSP